jgi:hypothetical protein
MLVNVGTRGTRKITHLQDSQRKYIMRLLVEKKHILFTVEKDAEEQCHRSARALSNQRIKAWKYNNNNRYGYQAFKFFFLSIVQMIYHEYYL